MSRNFDLKAIRSAYVRRGPRFWLQAAVVVLGVLNAVALFFYFFPPGGSRSELQAESNGLKSSIAAARTQSVRLKTVSGKVQLGSEQATGFEAHYILPKRSAYEAVIAEVQQMAQKANITEREGQISEEPIEGSPDLSVLTDTVNFEGPYPSLMKFLYEVDRSPTLLILDSLTATPQNAGQITAQARFQAVIREEPSPVVTGRP